MGEFGAVYVVSGHITGRTDTMPLRVEKLFQEYHTARLRSPLASVLTLLALVTLVVKVVLELEAPRPATCRAEAGPEPRRRVMSITVKNVSQALRRVRGAGPRQPGGARAARCWPCWGRPARARRRCCASSPAWRRPTPARSLASDEDVTRPAGPRPQRRLRLPALRPVPPHDASSRTSPSACASRLAGRPRCAERVRELLHLVRLEGLERRYPSQLSGGQRQRVALARALAAEPRVLLLDEPFGALDAKVRQELRQWLRRLHDEIHVTSIFVTHDQEEAFEVADRVVVMNQGRVEQAGTPAGGVRAPGQRLRHGLPGQRQRLPRPGAATAWRTLGGLAGGLARTTRTPSRARRRLRPAARAGDRAGAERRPLDAGDAWSTSTRPGRSRACSCGRPDGGDLIHVEDQPDALGGTGSEGRRDGVPRRRARCACSRRITRSKTNRGSFARLPERLASTPRNPSPLGGCPDRQVRPCLWMCWGDCIKGPRLEAVPTGRFGAASWSVFDPAGIGCHRTPNGSESGRSRVQRRFRKRRRTTTRPSDPPSKSRLCFSGHEVRRPKRRARLRRGVAARPGRLCCVVPRRVPPPRASAVGGGVLARTAPTGRPQDHRRHGPARRAAPRH